MNVKHLKAICSPTWTSLKSLQCQLPPVQLGESNVEIASIKVVGCFLLSTSHAKLKGARTSIPEHQAEHFQVI